MNGTWTGDFEVSLDGEKRVVVKPYTHISDFGTLSLCFENHILTHIMATLILRKGSLSNISTRYVFVLYFMLKNTALTGRNGSRRICGDVLKT